MAIGDRIRKRREELGWSQQELADRMGYKSKSTINKIEQGVNGVSQKGVVDFAKTMNTTIDYLMEMDGDQEEYYLDPETARKAQIVFEDKDLVALLDAAWNSRPEDISMAADLLRRLKQTNPDG